MKEIVVISGKGGTGKTSLAAAFAYLGGQEVIVADCDVDAADMHLLLKPDFGQSQDFYSGALAVIDNRKCTMCGRCHEVCRFEAVVLRNGRYVIDPFSCEGCGYCSRVCPEGAITDIPVKSGQWFISNIKTGSVMVHARLAPGAGNSGKLVARVKNEARQVAKEKNKDYIIVDGSPGTGCPVVSSLSGAAFVVLVTEPSLSGYHDLKRVHQLVQKFHIRAGCIINKSDINQKVTGDIEKYLQDQDILNLGRFLYDERFTEAMTRGLTIVEYDGSDLKKQVEESWNMINHAIQ
ncbi:MAG: ATP-binding protein [Bacteroidales bacterium]|nr:ATP-binding protein [Bacteroidales bacterium]